MAKLYVLIGGNIGDKQKIFGEARIQILNRIGKICKQSPVYESEPWGFSSPDMFWNQALEISTVLTPRKVLETIGQIETSLGRFRQESRYNSRIIDIDILFYDHQIINEPDLIVPHPRIHERRFALLPMADLAPGYTHPVLQKNIMELISECPDQLKVIKIGVE